MSGGAIAFRRPIAASGSRGASTRVDETEKREVKRDFAILYMSGGQELTVVSER